MTKVVEVAAAILLREVNGNTEFLLAQRPHGKVYSGYWEFPGGKVEPGESLREALLREIQEELGVKIECAWPWLSCEFTYPHARVRLKFFRVTSWHGEISPIEHSGFVWIKIGDSAPVSPVLPANGPILRALELAATYALTNATENGIDNELARLDRALNNGLRLIQIRDKALPDVDRRNFATSVMQLARRFNDTIVLVNDDESLASEIGAHGLHISSDRLSQISQRPPFEWVAASCHNAAELSLATALNLDFAVLSPVLPTASHTQTQSIGWERFANLIERSSLPIFALGGMKPEMLELARQKGAHGLAMMRGWH